MSKPMQLISSIPIAGLTVPSSTALYPLGAELSFVDGNGIKATYKYVQSAVGGMTANGAYFIEPNYVTAIPYTSAVAKEFGVAEVDFTASYYGWVKVEGMTTLITEAAGSTAANTGSLEDAVTTILDEAGTVETALTVGTINDTDLVGGIAVSVTLLRKRVTVA